MNCFRNRQLEAVARFAFNQVLTAPETETKYFVSRSRLLYAMSETTPQRGNMFYRLLSGLEHSPFFGATLTDAPKPEVQYSTTELSSLPQATAFDDGKDFAYVQFFGELAFQNYADHLAAIEKAKRITMHINSGGGCTRTALKLADALGGKTVEAIVTRKACSSACTLLQAATHRKIYANARLMVHQSRAATFGTSAELRTQADELDAVREQVKALFHRSPAHLVDKWFHTGDHWFNAQEALAVGLVDEIIPTPETPQHFFPDQMPIIPPVETDADADAIRFSTEMLFRLRGTFSDKTRFNELLEKFTK